MKILRSLDALFVISNQLKSLYIDMGLDEDRIHIVNMFVDTTRFEGLKKRLRRIILHIAAQYLLIKMVLIFLLKPFRNFI